MQNSVSKTEIWEGYFRIRISEEFKVNQILGNFSYYTSDLISLPAATPNKTFTYFIDKKVQQGPNPSYYPAAQLVIQVFFFNIIFVEWLIIYNNRKGKKISCGYYANPSSSEY